MATTDKVKKPIKKTKQVQKADRKVGSVKGVSKASKSANADGLYSDMDALADDIIDEEELNLNEVKKMNYEELFELIHFFEIDNDMKTVEILKPYLEKLHTPPIAVASLEDRIWSYFYEKYIIRIILVLWGIIGYNLKEKIFSWFSLESEVFMNGKEVSTIALILGAGAAVIILIWRLYAAYMESTLNVKKRHALMFRRSIRILVINEDGSIPGMAKSFFRAFFRAFPFSFLTILTMQNTKNGRGIHDKIFKTIVLKMHPEVTDQEVLDYIKFNPDLF